jgi:hypothetical protein
MAKSRRYIKRSSQTKRGKRGGQKNENYNPILSTQMQGGQAAPRPAPAPAGLNIYTIDAVSLRNSLQSFGDAVYAFEDTAETGLDTFKIPTGIPNPEPTSGASYSLLFAQKNSSANLLTAANNVVKAFYNTNSSTVDGIPGGGIFRAIYGSSAVFVATPMPPAPPPTAVGGFMHIGGVAPAPRPRPAPAGNGLVIASEAALLASLQAFGNKLIAFRTASEAQVAQLASPDISDFQPNAATGAAYGAFVAQQTAASNLVDAAKAVLAAFAGSPSVAVPDVTGATVYDGVNGIRGLYRAIMGNSANFIAT